MSKMWSKMFFFCFIVTISQSQQSHSCTILDMSHYSNTSDLISLSWDLPSEWTYWNFQTFKITVRHQKFLACNNKTNNSATTYKTDKQSITLTNLHPFSLYGIRIVLITGTIMSDIETTLKISTPISAPSVPQFWPNRSDQYFYASAQAIKFFRAQVIKWSRVLKCNSGWIWWCYPS